jgi:hypothetical protein
MSSGVSNVPGLVNQLPTSFELPKEFPLFREHLLLHLNRISNAVNRKEGSYYDLIEQGNFQQYYTAGTPYQYRNVYRYVFDMVEQNGGEIAAGATVSVAHNIVGITQATRIYGSATNSDSPIKFLPLPYVNATTLNMQIEIYLTPTNIVLINGEGQSILTSATIVAEYLKN